MNLEILGLILLIIVLNTLLSPFSKNSALYCGIVGFSSKDGKYDLLKIKFLLYWNSIERGTDSTGIYIPEVGILKDNIRAEYFINDKEQMDLLVPSDTLLAHVRAKTLGANTVENAHPFHYGRIIGLHNGTLKNHLKLCKDYDFDTKDYAVDSQVLISAMNRNFEQFEGIHRFKVLEEYEGAAALLFYDEWEDSIYACHDKERPLYYGYINDDMYISSIKDSLEVIGCEKVISFPINTVHKIKAGEIVETFKYTPHVEVVLDKTLMIGTFSDLVRNKEGKITLPDNCKGLIASLARGYMLKGFWLYVDSAANCEGFSYGRWYYCKDYVTGSNGYDDKLICYDNNGKEGILYLRNICPTNFIPVVDDYVKLTYDIIDEKKKVVGLAGDECIVKKYNYQDDTLTVFNIRTNKSIYLYSECVRNLNYEERTKVIKELKESKEKTRKAEFEKAKQAVMFPAKLGIPIVKKEPLLIEEKSSNSEYPFTDTDDSEIIESNFELLDEDLFFSEEGYVTSDTYTQFILETIETLEEIQCCLILGQTEKAVEETDKAVSRIKEIYNNKNYEIIV